MNKELEHATEELGWAIRWYFTSWMMKYTTRRMTYEEWRSYLNKSWTFKQAYESYRKQHNDTNAQAFIKDMVEAVNYLFEQWFGISLTDVQIRQLEKWLR